MEVLGLVAAERLELLLVGDDVRRAEGGPERGHELGRRPGELHSLRPRPIPSSSFSGAASVGPKTSVSPSFHVMRRSCPFASTQASPSTRLCVIPRWRAFTRPEGTLTSSSPFTVT